MQTPGRIAKNSAFLKGLTARNLPRCLKDGDFGRIKHLKAYRNTEKCELPRIIECIEAVLHPEFAARCVTLAHLKLTESDFDVIVGLKK